MYMNFEPLTFVIDDAHLDEVVAKAAVSTSETGRDHPDASARPWLLLSTRVADLIPARALLAVVALDPVALQFGSLSLGRQAVNPFADGFEQRGSPADGVWFLSFAVVGSRCRDRMATRDDPMEPRCPANRASAAALRSIRGSRCLT